MEKEEEGGKRMKKERREWIEKGERKDGNRRREKKDGEIKNGEGTSE